VEEDSESDEGCGVDRFARLFDIFSRIHRLWVKVKVGKISGAKISRAATKSKKKSIARYYFKSNCDQRKLVSVSVFIIRHVLTSTWKKIMESQNSSQESRRSSIVKHWVSKH
jgi:hypothetical protein